NREVYFPKNSNWFNFYTGEFIKGGQTLTVDAPYEQIPLFLREGAIIPVGPEIQYTDEKPADHIILYVYQGKDGHFTLYEDESENYNYEKGNFSKIAFNYNDASKTVTIEDRQGAFEGMLKNRTFEIVTISKEQPKAFIYDAKGKTIEYDGKKQTISLK
ncbi:MAG TPA: DUF5110 domain-containing protein, partial [Mariniflexile sp.]